jgi:poly-gamma-glutamate synthesis protein (capsule biosynthesis protein)
MYDTLDASAILVFRAPAALDRKGSSMTSPETPHPSPLLPNWREANVPDGFSVSAVGDVICTEAVGARIRRQSPELVDFLGTADVVFGNFEGTSFDLGRFAGYPEALSGGGWLLGSARVPADLAGLGFNLMSRANNHTTDWGVAGMRATDALLDEAGIVHAGTGETLAQARAAAVLSLPGARVSLVSFASRFEANARAIDAVGQVPARPGLSALRATRHAMVSPEQLEQLRKIRDSQPRGSVRASVFAADERDGTVTLFGMKYAARTTPGEELSFTFKTDPRDEAELMRAIRQAKQTTEFLIVGIHTHEPGNYSAQPPDFLERVARQAVDNGADMVVGHGPHQLRGIELYRGRPIFYSLGNFFFMTNTLQPLTRDEYEHSHLDPVAMTDAESMEKLRVEGVFKESVWFESVAARASFHPDGRVRRIELHPVEMHWDGGRDADRGIPRSAPPETGRAILRRLAELSQPYGTQLEVTAAGLGVIHA